MNDCNYCRYMHFAQLAQRDGLAMTQTKCNNTTTLYLLPPNVGRGQFQLEEYAVVELKGPITAHCTCPPLSEEKANGQESNEEAHPAGRASV